MTDIEKQIEIKRERADVFSRTRPSRSVVKNEDTNFFASSEAAKAKIENELKEFNTYKPLDLAEIFNELSSKHEVIKETKPEPELAKKAVYVETETKKKQEFDKDFINITKLDETIAPATYEIPVPREYQGEKFGIKFNLRGKLITFVASIAILCLIFLAIFNAVIIKNLKSEIGGLNANIKTESELLNLINDKYNYMTDENTLHGRVEEEVQNGNYSKIPPENVIEFSLLEKAAVEAKEQGSNWFDAFCNFIYRLFGG